MTTAARKVPTKSRRSLMYKPGARKLQVCQMIQGKARMHPAIRDILKLVIIVSMGEVAMKDTCKCWEVMGRAIQPQSLSHCQKARPVPAARPMADLIIRLRSSWICSQKVVAAGNGEGGE